MERQLDAEAANEEPEKRETRVEAEDVFATEEIQVEEMAIDGICGVY